MTFLKYAGFLAALVVFCACAGSEGEIPRTRYYTLEYEPPRLTEINPCPVVIKLAPFSVAPGYDSLRMAYRENSFKRDNYFYAKWRVNPADITAHFLQRDMRESGLFKAVLPHQSEVVAPLTMEGHVLDFYERDGPESWEAVLTITITLIWKCEIGESGKILLHKSYTDQEPCKQKNPKGLAQAMSLAMSRTSKRIILDIHSKVEKIKIGLNDLGS